MLFATRKLDARTQLVQQCPAALLKAVVSCRSEIQNLEGNQKSFLKVHNGSLLTGSVSSLIILNPSPV
jgi:hypothetical protein